MTRGRGDKIICVHARSRYENGSRKCTIVFKFGTRHLWKRHELVISYSRAKEYDALSAMAQEEVNSRAYMWLGGTKSHPKFLSRNMDVLCIEIYKDTEFIDVQGLVCDVKLTKNEVFCLKPRIPCRVHTTQVVKVTSCSYQ